MIFFFQAEDGIRDLVRSRGLGDVYKRQELKKVKCRTLLCGAEADFVPPEANEQLHKALKNSEYYLFESCGHFPFVESKDEFERVVIKFMTK